nr:hypothetical protein [Helicobacter bilis]
MRFGIVITYGGGGVIYGFSPYLLLNSDEFNHAIWAFSVFAKKNGESSKTFL